MDIQYKIGDCLELMKELPDNSVDSIVTDPPYFLIDKNGNGFMGKKWDSLNSNDAYSIICKSGKVANSVVRFFLSLKIESNMGVEYIVQKSANTKMATETPSNANVQSVEKSLKGTKAKSKASTSSVQGIVLTKAEVLDMLKEKFSNHITPIENLPENVLFAIPITFIKRNLKNIAVGDALKLPTENLCSEKTTQVSLMEEVRIKNVIGGMIGYWKQRLGGYYT